MERPESCPAYLVGCAENFLEAISEARALALEGDVGDRLVETLHYASDLLDIIADGLAGPESDPAALDALNDMRDQVNALRRPSRTRGAPSPAARIPFGVSPMRIERSAERLADLGLADRLDLRMLLLDFVQLRAIARLHPFAAAQ
jgi:hypothetical protein